MTCAKSLVYSTAGLWLFALELQEFVGKLHTGIESMAARLYVVNQCNDSGMKMSSRVILLNTGFIELEHYLGYRTK